MTAHLGKVLYIFGIWSVVYNEGPEGHIVVKQAVECSQVDLAWVEVAEDHKHLLKLCVVHSANVDTLLEIESDSIDQTTHYGIDRNSCKFVRYLRYIGCNSAIGLTLNSDITRNKTGNKQLAILLCHDSIGIRARAEDNVGCQYLIIRPLFRGDYEATASKKQQMICLIWLY